MIGGGKPKILVTRPQPGADLTATRLAAVGIEALILPFTEMVTLAHQLDEIALDHTDAVVVTSANALRHTNAQLLNELKNLPVYTVGDATKDAAFELGLGNVTSANGDGSDLARLVVEKMKPNSSIVYLCGRTRTEDVELSLGNSGFEICVVETYQTNKVSQLTYNLKQLMEHHTIDGILLYSGVSAQIYSEFLLHDGIGESLVIPMSFCISERAKAALFPSQQSHAVVCAQPRDDVMIETVEAYFRPKN